MIPEFSEKRIFTISCSLKLERLISMPKLLSVKHISNKLVISPPEDMS